MERDDFERKLERLPAKEPPAALRERLLSRAREEIARRPSRGLRCWRFRLAMAAAFVLALGADLAAERITDARVAAVVGARETAIVQRDRATIDAAVRQRAQLLALLRGEREWE